MPPSRPRGKALLYNCDSVLERLATPALHSDGGRLKPPNIKETVYNKPVSGFSDDDFI